MTPEEYELEWLVAQEIEALRTGKPVKREASAEWLAEAKERLREVAEEERRANPGDMEPVDPETVFGGEG